MWKYEIYGDRYYYYFAEPDGFVYAPSATTICRKLLPEDNFVTIKKSQMGIKEFNSWFGKKADFGTVLHIVIKDYLLNGKILMNDVKELMRSYRIDESENSRMVKAILAIKQFIDDYEIVIDNNSVIEGSFISKLGFGGTIDCFAYSQNLGKYLLIDWKSGSYQNLPLSYDLQLGLYGIAISEIMPNITDITICVVCPKDWRKNPNYSIFDYHGILSPIDEINRYKTLWSG